MHSMSLSMPLSWTESLDHLEHVMGPYWCLWAGPHQILCPGRMILNVFSPFIVLGILSIRYITKWSGESLYGINMLSRDSFSSYDLLFMRPFRLRMSLYPTILFRLNGAFYVGVVRKMLITYFFDFPFSHRTWYNLFSKYLILLGVDLGSIPCHGSFFFSKGSSLKSLITKLMLAILVYYIWRERNARLHGEAPYNSSIFYSDIVNYCF